MNKIFTTLFFAGLFFIMSCSGSNKLFIDTYSMRITSGKVTAYEFEKGDKTRKVTTSDILSGKVELSLPSTNTPVLIELTNATYVDISTGKSVEFLPNEKWTTIITSPQEFNGKTISLNPVTTIAAAFAIYKVAYAADEKAAIDNAKSSIGEHFKVDMDESPIKEGSDLEASTDTDVQTYYILMAGISRLVQGINELNEKDKIFQKISLNEFLQIIWDDLSYDGVLDGRAYNTDLMFGSYKFGAKTLKEDLVWAIRLYISEHNITENEEIFSLIQNILNNTSGIFISDELSDFDAPTIIVFSPIGGGYSSKEVNIRFEAYDNTESGIAYTEARLEHPAIGAVEDLNPADYIFEGTVDSSLLNDGPAYVHLTALDGNNNKTEKILPFKIDNTKPAIITSLENDSFVRGLFATAISINDEFGSGISSLSVKLAGVPADKLVAAGAGQYDIEHQTTTLPDGLSQVEISASDACGNTAILTKNIFINNNILTADHFKERTSVGSDIAKYATECAGDLNNDGYADIINTNYSFLENIHVLLGNSSNEYIDPVFPENIPAGYFSYTSAVATNCDFDNDGHPDFVIGDPRHLLGAGRFAAFFSPLNSQLEWKNSIFKGAPNVFPGVEGLFGTSVACADMNGDGYDDIISSYGSLLGGTHVYYGPVFNTHTKISDNTGEITNIGYNNGDSAEDIALGSQVIMGSTSGQFSFPYDLPGNIDSITNIGDINDDGYTDIIVGYSTYIGSSILGSGFARVIYGGVNFPNQFFELYSPEYAVGFGKSAAASDVDGDGNIDILISAPQTDVFKGGETINQSGKIFVFLGPDYNQYRTLTSEFSGLYDRFGSNLRSGFDINNDGLGDVITQQPGGASGSNDVGSFHVLYDLNE